MKTAIRGALLSFRGDPFRQDPRDCVETLSDAVVVMEAGKIVAVGDASAILPTLAPEVEVVHYRDSVILPGFIDAHAHYPQTGMIGAWGEQLIDWLNNYTFVTEQAFADKVHARAVADVFLDEQLRNGVTSACVFSTVHAASVEALFESAARHNMRIMTGKVCMDRNAPEPLLDTAERAYEESRALIGRWHGRGRAEYVITPRFAPTSTEAQLDVCGTLAREFPDTLIQTHLSENLGEVAWVGELFPGCRDYTDVYVRHGLVRERAIFGHAIHLSEVELEVLHASGAAIAHCPTSNFFLGSGAFDVKRAHAGLHPVKVGLATDVGAGTSFSMLQTMNEAYKAAQLNHYPLTAMQAFWMATRGAAEALGIADKVGSIAVGMEADLAVLDLQSTPLIRFRMASVKDMEEALFVQMTLGDDRAIAATWVDGKQVHQR